MKIRFLQTTSSDRPEYPFMPGQVIDLPRLTTQARQWLKSGHAELVREIPEAAVVDSPERAVLVGAKAKR